MLVAITDRWGLRRPSSVGATVDGWVYLELAARGRLDAVSHRLGDNVIPLGNGAAGDADSPGDGCPVVIEVRKHGRLKHAVQSTAC
jgi:hypothetical protein